MRSAAKFYVFDRWREAPSFAFGSPTHPAVVPAEDKDAYWDIHSELLASAETAVQRHTHGDRLFLRPKRFFRDSGSRGHRPVDLWVSICATGAEHLGYMPQVYAIASHRGLEIGFAASIPEEDYFDAHVKERNRAIVPFINSKLPEPAEELVTQIDRTIGQQGGWHLNRQTRLVAADPGFDEFTSVAALLAHLKTAGEETGGGTVCKVFSALDLASVDLEEEFQQALNNFAPLLARCAPTPWDISVRDAQDAVLRLADDVEFDPSDDEDGRRKVWAEVARRQGQAAFRGKLLAAYEGACAISGTAVTDVLQAAHIRPYNGPKTNHVTNGLLLRADLHTLFDLRLISISPATLTIVVSSRLRDTPYWEFQGRRLRVPVRTAHAPNADALKAHFTIAQENLGSLPPHPI